MINPFKFGIKLGSYIKLHNRIYYVDRYDGSECLLKNVFGNKDSSGILVKDIDYLYENAEVLTIAEQALYE